MRVLVVGAGIAAISCLEQLDADEAAVRVTLLTPESAVRTVANVRQWGQRLETFSVGTSSVEQLCKRYSRLFLNVKQGVAVELDTAGRRVTAEDAAGKRTWLEYDELVLCCGADPVVPEWARGCADCVAIRDEESVRALHQRLASGVGRVILAGSGAIALELVHQLAAAREVVWVMRAAQPGRVFFDAAAVAFLRPGELRAAAAGTAAAAAQTEGVAGPPGPFGPALGPKWFHVLPAVPGGSDGRLGRLETVSGAEIVRLERTTERQGLECVLSTGKRVAGDLVVLALGVTPRTGWLVNSGLEIQDGIRVDALMRTSDPHILAAGDAVTCAWGFAPDWFQMRLWTQARIMGAQAARTLACRAASRPPPLPDFAFELFHHVTEFFGLQVVLLGRFDAQSLAPDSVERLVRCTPGVELVQVYVDRSTGVIRGCSLIGETGLDQALEHLMLDQLDVRPFLDRLLDPSVDLEDVFD